MKKTIIVILIGIILSCSSTPEFKLSETQEKYFDVKEVSEMVKESKTMTEIEREKIGNALERCELGKESLINEINILKKSNTLLIEVNKEFANDVKRLNKELNETKEDAGKFYGIQYVVGSLITIFILVIIFIVIRKAGFKIPFLSN